MRTDLASERARLACDFFSGLPMPVETAEFCTERFIASLDPKNVELCDRVTLERLTRKIEVARKLYQAYQPDLSKATSDVPARSEFAVYLAIYYLHAGYSLGDWKWINTGVKMTEGILLVPALDVPAELKSVLALPSEPQLP